MSDDFTVKDYDRIIDDIMDEYFDLHDLKYDVKELRAKMLGDRNAATPDI